MNHSRETATTQFVKADGVRYAYRRLGKSGSVPLLFMEYFNSNMDGWDPLVTNSLAADHEVILFNNAGVASSGGEAPATETSAGRGGTNDNKGEMKMRSRLHFNFGHQTFRIQKVAGLYDLFRRREQTVESDTR